MPYDQESQSFTTVEKKTYTLHAESQGELRPSGSGLNVSLPRHEPPGTKLPPTQVMKGNLLQRAQGIARSAPDYRCVVVAAADRLPAGSTARTAVTNPPRKAVPDTPYVAVNSPPGHAWSRS